MKVAHIHVDCCRECPFAESVIGVFSSKACTLQDDKRVDSGKVDDGCPLDDEGFEQS